MQDLASKSYTRILITQKDGAEEKRIVPDDYFFTNADGIADHINSMVLTDQQAKAIIKACRSKLTSR